MSDESNTVRLLSNQEYRCVLEFDGEASLNFMEAIFRVLFDETTHMLICDACKDRRGLNDGQIRVIQKLAENILMARGYERQEADDDEQPSHDSLH